MPEVDSHAREDGEHSRAGRGRDGEFAYRTVRRTAPAPEPRREDARTLGAVAAGHHRSLDTTGVVRLQRSMGNAVIARAMKKTGGEDKESPAVEAVKTGGSPLPEGVRTQMEDKLGADLGHVRVHTDSQAVQANKDLGARAYTLGSDIAFDAGAFAPDTADGRRLLAHELTHVVQQGSRQVEGTPGPGGVKVSDPHDADEREAEETAQRATR